MPKIPILCMSCGSSIPEEEYLQHMQSVHGTIHTDEAMKKERTKKANIPAPVVPTELPLGVRPEDLPSPEFLAIAKEIDTAPPLSPLPKLDLSKSPIPSTPKTDTISQPVTPQTPSVKESKPKPLELKYIWEGTHACGNTVKTIMIEANKDLFSVAFCLTCNEVVKKMKVHPIIETVTVRLIDKKTKEITGEIEVPIKKESKKHE